MEPALVHLVYKFKRMPNVEETRRVIDEDDFLFDVFTDLSKGQVIEILEMDTRQVAGPHLQWLQPNYSFIKPPWKQWKMDYWDNYLEMVKITGT